MNYIEQKQTELEEEIERAKANLERIFLIVRELSLLMDAKNAPLKDLEYIKTLRSLNKRGVIDRVFLQSLGIINGPKRQSIDKLRHK